MVFSSWNIIMNYLINVKYDDGDGDDNASGNRNNIKQSGENPNETIALYKIFNVINYWLCYFWVIDKMFNVNAR